MSLFNYDHWRTNAPDASQDQILEAYDGLKLTELHTELDNLLSTEPEFRKSSWQNAVDHLRALIMERETTISEFLRTLPETDIASIDYDGPEEMEIEEIEKLIRKHARCLPF